MLVRPAILALSLSLATPPVQAEIRAVIVGVSDYTVLDADLKGPSNDAALMAETLAGRGVSADRMTVLASDLAGLPGGVTTGAPTRAGILGALDAAAKAASPGDTVVFYFSGHGAQAPDLSGDESGGYDEILLPSDAAGWKGAIGAVENALVDDELQVWAQGALDKGLKVVALIDACHSATGFRAIGGTGQARVIEPDRLGIPDDIVPATGEAAQGLDGEFVFLYSSQSDQRSFEYPMPDGTWHGEFTLRLAQTLRGSDAASWAQVLAATTEIMVQGPARQMPDGEGPLLSAQVFGDAVGGLRYPVQAGKLAAGLLDGLSEGSEIAFFAQPAGGPAMGHAVLSKVAAREAVMTGPAPAGAAWAEVVAAPPPAPLVLAAPVLADPEDQRDYSAWTSALPSPGSAADLVPILTDGTIALAGPDGILDPLGPGSTPRIRPEAGETPAAAIERALAQAARGLGLRKALAGATGRSLTGKAALTVSTERRAARGGCGEADAAQAFDPAEGVAPCDQIWLTIRNASGTAQDVSVLYFTADFEVQPIWPGQSLSNRLAPGESVRVGLMIEPGSVAGLEEIWTLAVPAAPDAPRVDLTRLAMTEATRGTESDPMTAWLEARLDPEAKARGFTLKPAPLTMLRQMVRLTSGDRVPEEEEN